MIRVERAEANDVIFISKVPAELQLARMILKFMCIEPEIGVSPEGTTLHLSKEDAKRFEDEAKDWKKASAAICDCFPR